MGDIITIGLDKSLVNGVPKAKHKLTIPNKKRISPNLLISRKTSSLFVNLTAINIIDDKNIQETIEINMLVIIIVLFLVN